VPYVRARIGCAGQEIYYSTHQFFLSERSLYVVVFNLLAPEQSHVEYWYVILFSSLSLSLSPELTLRCVCFVQATLCTYRGREFAHPADRHARRGRTLY
jgi:hypothetical protein